MQGAGDLADIFTNFFLVFFFLPLGPRACQRYPLTPQEGPAEASSAPQRRCRLAGDPPRPSPAVRAPQPPGRPWSPLAGGCPPGAGGCAGPRRSPPGCSFPSPDCEVPLSPGFIDQCPVALLRGPASGFDKRRVFGVQVGVSPLPSDPRGAQDSPQKLKFSVSETNGKQLLVFAVR